MSEIAKTTIINYSQIQTAIDGCVSMVGQLQTIETEIGELMTLIEETYEGDAKAEMDDFLEGFEKHIYRLEMLYVKIIQFLAITRDSFQTNDREMAKEGE